MGFDDSVSQGRPRGLGQPWAGFCDTFSVVIMPRCARKKIYMIEIRTGDHLLISEASGIKGALDSARWYADGDMAGAMSLPYKFSRLMKFVLRVVSPKMRVANSSSKGSPGLRQGTS